MYTIYFICIRIILELSLFDWDWRLPAAITSQWPAQLLLVALERVTVPGIAVDNVFPSISPEKFRDDLLFPGSE